MEVKIKSSPIYQKINDTNKRILVLQGGTRAAKTYTILQFLVVMMLRETGKVVTICRRTLPALKASAMKDFFEIIEGMGLYDINNHNKTESTYILNGNEVEFIAIDQPIKVRGRKRNYLFMNEANEMRYEDFLQLSFRTTERIFMDYNPHEEYSYIYEKVLTRDDVFFLKASYRDNPFLDEQTIREIERLKDLDQNYWRIYGLGERGISETTIYTHWQFIDQLPSGDEFYGLDFGYNNPTAMVKIVLHDDDIYAQERLYRTHLNTSEIIQLIKDQKIGHKPLYCDAEDPRIIDELKRAGLNAVKADKGQDSVKAGIDAIKKRKFFITKDSINMLKEVKSYRWRVKDEKALDEPVKENDHIMDATRYAVYTHLRKPVPGIFMG